MTDSVAPATPPGSGPKAPASDTDRIIQVLGMEYQYLTAQIIARLSARYQFLGFLTAAAAILAVASSHPFFSGGTYVLASLAGAVFLFGLICYWSLGRFIATLSVRVARIERRINELFPDGDGHSKVLLSWETERRELRSIGQFIQGFVPPPS